MVGADDTHDPVTNVAAEMRGLRVVRYSFSGFLHPPKRLNPIRQDEDAAKPSPAAALFDGGAGGGGGRRRNGRRIGHVPW